MKPVGKVLLLEKLEEGLTFYVDSPKDFITPVTYIGEKWLVEVVESTQLPIGFRKKMWFRRVWSDSKRMKDIRATYDEKEIDEDDLQPDNLGF